MKVVLMGNSMVRSLKPKGFDEIICMPGASWESILNRVTTQHNYFERSLIYVMIGPVRFTKLVREKSQKEVVYNTPQVHTDVIASHVRTLKQQYQIFVVMATLTPIDFVTYNTKLRSHQYSQLHINEHSGWTTSVSQDIIEVNKRVVEMNIANNVITPFVHKGVLLRRHGQYVFRPKFLKDGLHPSNRLVEVQNKELTKNLKLNLLNIIWNHYPNRFP